MKTTTGFKRFVSLLVCAALIAGLVPAVAAAEIPVAQSAVADIVIDPGTAHSWESMMGTDIDGNRYAGRVWVDKSLYKDGDTAILNTRGEEGSSFQVSLKDDEAFQVIFSVLGSTMSSKSTVTSTGPMDVVLVLDTSTSMDDEDNQGVTRLERTITAANALLDDLLTISNVRVAIVTYNYDSETVLPLASYTGGINLVVNNYYNNNRTDAGVVYAYDDNNNQLGKDSGYTMGTNLQAGIDRGFNILANASDTEGRIPVSIVLTDGQANRANRSSFYNITGTDSASGDNLYLSTLLNAAYNKAKVEENYGVEHMVYGVGVDLGTNTTARLLMNPADPAYGFNSNNYSARNAYNNFLNWADGETVTNGNWNSRWTFDHNYPNLNGAITDAKIAANINYVDSYYDVTNADLQDAFQQIYQELISGAFNPISSSTATTGGTGVEHTPLIYVDFIGQHMEIKEIQAVTLFGSSYGVVKNADGTYTVAEAIGKNPTTNENWNTARDIRISVTEENGIQKLELRINQEILPIIMEQVVSETVGEVTTSTITELLQQPLRVFYTIGVDSDVLLPNGELDISKIQGYQNIDDTNGTVSLYAGQFGVMNPADSSGTVMKGDSHVGFKPSSANRYYYHQANQGIFTQITNRADGSVVTIPENEEYGIVWDENQYDLHWMTYEEYLAAQDTDKVYTYVTYYHPTPSSNDAADAAEEVTYLIYADWGYLKESVAFYDASTGTYLNNGAVVSAAEAAAYKQANPNAELYAVLGVGSLRTSRLHNMTVAKNVNLTNTAVDRYAPEYTHETANDHNGNDVVVWLGNNGVVTLQIDTGIALTKEVTEAIGNPGDTYALTVTVPAGVTAAPVVLDAEGNTVTSTYAGNVLTVPVKAGQTVYISGIPGGTECTIGENIDPDGDYYLVTSASDSTVRVPLVSEVLNGAQPVAQFAPAVVTNAPHKYGDLTIIKDIAHNLSETPEEMARKEFTFKVELSPVPAPENRVLRVDKTNAPAFTGDTVTVQNDGSFEVTLKDNESITILGLPEGTGYTVTETSVVDGYTNTSGTITGVIEADGDHDAHFINAYAVTPIKPQITVAGQKILNDIHNTYTADESFAFILSQYTGAENNPYSQLAIQNNVKAGESYSFQLDQLLTEPLGLGNHYFRVTEQAGTTNGMTYDATRGLFVVHVTDDNADGVLEYTIENLANTTVSGNTVTKNFTNTYDVERAHADIVITKTLDNETGVELPLDLFHFVLVNTENANETYTVTTDRSGKATIRIPNLAERITPYVYTLSEVNGGMPGMAYDAIVYTVKVTVTNDNGVLKAVAELEGATQANGDDTLDVSFRNTYNLQSTTHTISGSKLMKGKDPVTGDFEFALYETDSSFAITGAPIDTVRNTGKSFSFEELTYTKVGAHYYSVKEIKGNVPGVVYYDTTHYHITVHVGVSSTDPTKLAVTKVEINKIGSNSDLSGNVVFVNEYQATATAYTLGGHKILHGRAPRDGEFTFELYEGDTLLDTVTNKADGSFTFQTISYTQAGTHSYTIKEVAGSVSGVRYDGVNAPVTVTVTVTDTNGVLSAEASISNANIAFENTYTPKPAQITFIGTKALQGGTLADNTFAFKLYHTDNTFDITKNDVQLMATAQNVDGGFSFQETLTATGTYYYVVLEDISNPMEGVVYDRTHHRFAVQVTDIGDGQLKAVITNVTTGISSAAAASVSANTAFVNAVFEEVAKKEVYKEGNSTTHIDGQKVNAGDILTYFITYTNYTGETVVADIVDIIPAHTSYVEGSATLNGTYAGTHINWILSVAAKQSVTVSFQVKVDETDAIVANTAVVRDGVNTYYTNEVVNHSVESALKKDVFAAADPITSIDGQQVAKGDELLYKISFTNASANDVDIQITDEIPVNTTYVAGSADNGGAFHNGELVWNLENIPAWQTVTVSFKVTVNADVGAVTIENKATATDGTNNYETNLVTNYTVQAPTTPEEPSNPKTGDSFQPGMAAAIMAVCATALAALVIGQGKRKED